MVEEDSPHVIQVPVEREETSSCLIGPDFDFVVVSTRDEQGLRPVEIDSTHRSVMLFKPIDKGSHSIIP